MKTDWNLWRAYGPKGTICWITLPICQRAATYTTWAKGTAFERKGIVFSCDKARAQEVLSVFSGVKIVEPGI